MNPQVFGWQHLIYIAVSLLVAAGVFVCNGKFTKTEKAKNIVVKAPSYKRWRATLVGFTSYLAYGAFLLCVVGYGNPMYMTAPAIDGTIFTVWGLIPIYFVVYSLILFVLEIFRRKAANKRQGEKIQ